MFLLKELPKPALTKLLHHTVLFGVGMIYVSLSLAFPFHLTSAFLLYLCLGRIKALRHCWCVLIPLRTQATSHAGALCNSSHVPLSPRCMLCLEPDFEQCIQPVCIPRSMTRPHIPRHSGADGTLVLLWCYLNECEVIQMFYVSA